MVHSLTSFPSLEEGDSIVCVTGLKMIDENEPFRKLLERGESPDKSALAFFISELS